MVSTNSVSRDHYFLLASELEHERIKAAVELIKELQSVNNEKEWEYGLNRLMKGLSSSRAASRIGFSTALSEILNIRFKDGKIGIIEYLNTLEEQLKAVKSSKKGKDERANLFGRLFGLKALANSSLFIDAKGEKFDEGFEKFVAQLLKLSVSKSWIREPCFFTLFEFLGKLISQDRVSDEQLIKVLEDIDTEQLTLSTEGLAIYLLVIVHNKSYLFQQLSISNGWRENNPVKKSNLHILAKTLKNVDVSASSATDDLDSSEKSNKKKDSKQKGSWSPNLHFVWKVVINTVLKIETEVQSRNDSEEYETFSASDKKRKKKHESKSSKRQKLNNKNRVSENDKSDLIKLEEFWKIVVDDSLFSMKSSLERKYWGFKVFELFLTEFSQFGVANGDKLFVVKSLKPLFTENFMRTLINQSGNSNRMLNGLVKKEILNGFISKQLASGPKNVSLSLALIYNFLFSKYSNLNFDNITGTKTVESLINNVATFGDFSDLKGLVDWLLAFLDSPLTFLNQIEEKQLIAPKTKSKKSKKQFKKDEDEIESDNDDIEKSSKSDDDDDDDDDDDNYYTKQYKNKLIEKKQKWVVNQLSTLLKYYRVRLNTVRNNFIDKKEKADKKEVNSEWIDDIIKKFVIYGYFKPAGEIDLENYNEEVSKFISKKLNSLLLDILSFKRVDNHSWLYVALKEAVNIENEQKKLKTSKKVYVPVVDLDSELNKIKTKNFKILTKIIIKKSQLIQNNFSEQDLKKAAFIKKLSSFELIYSIILLHFYSDDSTIQDSIAILDEVNAAYKKFHLNQEISNDGSDDDKESSHEALSDSDGESKKSGTPASGSEFGDIDDNDQEYRSIDILLEIVLGFLHQKNSLSKKLSLIVWETFVSDLRYRNLRNLYDILLVKENVEGQKTLFDTADDKAEDGDEEDEEEEFEDEAEIEMDEDSEDGDEASPGSDSEAMDFLDKLDKKTTSELAKALNIPEEEAKALAERQRNKNGGDGEESSDDDGDEGDSSDSDDSDDSDDKGKDKVEDDDEDDSDEESMDDEQMMALDSQLALIFKQRKTALDTVKTGNKRKEEKIEAQENMVFFKNRILDLLEIYVDKILEKSSSCNDETHLGTLNDEKYLSLSLVSPLLSLMELTENGSLREKTHKLLKKVARIKVTLIDEYLSKEAAKKGKNEDEEGEGEQEYSFQINESQLFKTMEQIHAKAAKASSPALSGAYNQFSIYLSKILIHYNPKENYGKVIDIYGESMKNWMETKNSKLNPSMFYDLVNYFSSIKQQK